MSLRLAPDEQILVSARILPPSSVLVGWVIAVGAPFLGVGGWALTLFLLPLCLWNRLGRKVLVTNQRLAVTRMFGKTEMHLRKIESIDCAGVAGPGSLTIKVHGTGANSVSFSPLQRAGEVERALREAVAAIRPR